MPDTTLPTPEQGQVQGSVQEIWKVDKSGREYTARGNGSNAPLYRQGSQETPEQARERFKKAQSEKPKDKRPARRKGVSPPKADAPKQVDLKLLEHELAEILKAPAIPAAMYGDEYLCDHFTKSGPYLARNLVAAAEHNPWLRKKLEEMAQGQTMMMQVASLVPLVSGVIMYTVPPVLYLTNAGSDTTRDRLGVPERKPKNVPEYAAQAGGDHAAPVTTFTEAQAT